MVPELKNYENLIIGVFLLVVSLASAQSDTLYVDSYAYGEIKIHNRVLDEWEQIEFDFSAHIGNTYDQIVIFPNFLERDSDEVVYFDDVYGEVAMSTSVSDPSKIDLSLFPNPAQNFLVGQSEYDIVDYQIYSMLGELMEVQEKMSSNSEISVGHLEAGVYLFVTTIDNAQIMKKFVKN